MAAPIGDKDYHWLQFGDLTRAAIFVAALTRFLASTNGSRYLKPLASAEVWSFVTGQSDAIEQIDLYMNDVALRAIKELMGTRTPAMQKRQGRHMQPECILLIGGGGVEEWGTEEAQWHILSEE